MTHKLRSNSAEIVTSRPTFVPLCGFRTSIACAIFLLSTICCGQSRLSMPPDQLAREVVYNELHDHNAHGFWRYSIEQKVEDETRLVEQIETTDGPVARLLRSNGLPLDSARQQAEQARLDRLLSSPSVQARFHQQYVDDEKRVGRILAMILGLLTLGSLIWYLLTARTSGDLKLIGTVDANEVLVSAKIPGRIETLNVQEGQSVKAGDVLAIIESDDLKAAHKAAQAIVSSQQSKLGETLETERQTRGETTNATINAQAQVRAAQATLAQAQALLEHQQAETTRTVALAKQGIMQCRAVTNRSSFVTANRAGRSLTIRSSGSLFARPQSTWAAIALCRLSPVFRVTSRSAHTSYAQSIGLSVAAIKY